MLEELLDELESDGIYGALRLRVRAKMLEYASAALMDTSIADEIYQADLEDLEGN